MYLKNRTAEGLERALRKQSGGLFLARSVYERFPKNVNHFNEMRFIKIKRILPLPKTKPFAKASGFFFHVS